MPTFLTNAKMAPELAARIEACVHGRRGPVKARRLPRLATVLKLATIVAVATAVCAVVLTLRRQRLRFEGARAELLASVRLHGAALTPGDRQTVTRVESWLTRLAGAYEGDSVADELRAPKALEAALARRVIYVHGPIASFGGPAGIADAASSSTKDALLLCLVEPPANRNEKTLLSKARVAYLGGGRVEQRTASVRRLDEAELGLPFLSPPWAERVAAAAEMPDVEKLRHAFERAPIDSATRALKAELLLVAMDEMGDGSGPTELDGERAHDVRIALVDLASAKVLLRLRKHVDPSWITPASRIEYASGIDACALAFDVQSNVAPPAPAPVLARSGR